MRLLPAVKLTAEQLPLLNDNQPGTLVVRGAAGSGKTTTALMRLTQLCQSRLLRRTRLGAADPVRVLVLTFNRTLEGYIGALAESQVVSDPNLDLTVTTLGRWAKSLTSGVNLEPERADEILHRLCSAFPGDTRFLKDEVHYVLGRFEPSTLHSYVGSRRDGRGASPRMDDATRRSLLQEVIEPYIQEKSRLGIADWNDLAIAAARSGLDEVWDVVVVDETQDFSANELRAVLAHINDETSVTFIIDAAQQIYKRGFTWREVGVINPVVRPLNGNYRNTKEIAAFASPLVHGLSVGANGMLPNLKATTRQGPKPVVLEGRYAPQVAWAIQNVVSTADLHEESVAFLQFQGGGFTSTLTDSLDAAGVDWVELTRNRAWPGGDEAVAVCTLHSAKGLEFDHVVILGVNALVTPHGAAADDTDLDGLRRLMAMGIGRARKTVTVGYKPGEASKLIGFLDPATFSTVPL